ncbi:MAG: cupin domain-containing protein [Candidatus Anammoxibacter sp.]
MFTSKDFGKVPSSLKPSMPDDIEKLIHRQVRKTGVDKDFTAVRKHPIAMANLPSQKYSITFSEISPNSHGRKHRHTYHAIAIITKGKGHAIIEGKKLDWEAGDIFEVPVWSWHQLHNPHDEVVEYITFENAPEMLNSGTALREEE